MKSYKISLLHAGCLVAVFVAGFALRSLVTANPVNLLTKAQAQDFKAAARRCGTHTLKGSYGIKFEGKRILGDAALTSVSLITFDGVGNFTTNEIARFDGNLVQRTFTGPYVVNADCTGFLDFTSNLSDPPHEAHGDFVIVSEGKEFFLLDNEEGWAASGVAKKL